MNSCHSHRTEYLLERLKENIYRSTSPFARRLVVVSSPLMKEWIQWQLAQDPQCGIALGLEIGYLQPLLRPWLLGKTSKYLPNRTELVFAIEQALKEKKEKIELLANYLSEDRQGLKRLVRLADELAAHFLDYGLYGCSLDGHWQAEIWNEVFQNYPHWATPQSLLDSNQPLISSRTDIQIHLFGLNFIPPVYLELCRRLSHDFPVDLYLLSPCQHYWGDFSSDREIGAKGKAWERANLTVSSQQMAEDLLLDRHPLLANWGGLGRKMDRILEDSTQQEELYGEELEPKSLLEALQEGMVRLKGQDPEDRVSFPKSDCSIQIHRAANLRREVEIVYDALLSLFHKDPTLKPCEILMMAPDISVYAPHLESVFERFDLHFYDLPVLENSELFRAFFLLLDLAEGRWAAPQVLELFQYKGFKKKLRWKDSDVEEIKMWIEEFRIHWGQTVQHRKEILDEKTLVDEHEVGTWEYGFARLIDEMVAGKLPVTQWELAGQWIEVTRSLKKDLEKIRLQEQMTLQDWAFYLTALYQNYFEIDPRDEGFLRDEEALLGIIRELKEATQGGGINAVFAWPTIHHQLLFQAKKISFTPPHYQLQSIRCCSMLPMRAIPAKVVVIMGMEQENFPKRQIQAPLDLLNGSNKRPLGTEFDKYLMLEAILSARKALIMTYSSQVDEGHPSPLITEMLNLLDTCYTIDGDLPSKQCFIQHPFFSYDSFYFRGDRHQSYSERRFKQAQSYYHPKKDNFHFIKEIFDQGSTEWRESNASLEIPFHDLVSTFKSPLKLYFRERLGLRIEEESIVSADEPFVLDPLEKYQIKAASLKEPLEKVLESKNTQAKLPTGLFREVALRELQREIKNDDHLPPFFVQFHSGCFEKAKRANGSWVLPAIEVENGKIVGKFHDITEEGLLVIGSDSIEERIKQWPRCVILNLIADDLGLKRQILFIKDGKKIDVSLSQIDAKNYLENLVRYYRLCLSYPSPLLPDWIFPFFKDVQKAPKKMHESLYGQFPIYDAYALWGLARGPVDNLSMPTIEAWKRQWLTCIAIDHPFFEKLRQVHV